MSSDSSEWETPQDFFDELNKEFDFQLDPCATQENAKCDRFFTKSDNGLAQSWAGLRVFMNPPYGTEIKKWMAKALAESEQGALVVCLIPSRTDTKFWHDYAMKGDIRFIKGRLKFSGAKSSAPFPSAVIVFKAKS